MKSSREIEHVQLLGRKRVARAVLPLIAGMPLVCCLGVANASQEDYIVVDVEEPADGSIATGISNLRGWAVGKFGVERVEVLIDGEYKFDLPYGGKRGDVGSNYSYPDDEYSGFSMAYNYNLLDPGLHTVTIRAWDPYDDFNEITNTFEVVRFGEGGYVPGVDAFDMSDAVAAINGNDVYVYNAFLEDAPYNLVLSWNTPTQKPEIVDITAFDISQMVDADGSWHVEMNSADEECGESFSGTLPITSEEYALDVNGLELYFSGINPETLGVIFSGTQDHAEGDIEWAIEVNGNELSGSALQERTDCTAEYTLSGIMLEQ